MKVKSRPQKTFLSRVLFPKRHLNMFEDLSAWFSTSVDSHTKQLWRDHGGRETDFDTAQFIFSADNTSSDTQRVFNSTAYESEHLAVFHSRYITDCVRDGDRASMVLGHYFLPPQDIVNLVREQIRLCWDVPGEQSQSGIPVNKRVNIPTPPRPQTTQNRPALNNTGASQTSRQTTSSGPQRTGTTPSRLPVRDTDQQVPTASSLDQERTDCSSTQQGIRPLGRRPSQPANGASASAERHEQERVNERQGEEQRPSSRRQQMSEISGSSKQSAGQKRTVKAPASGHSSPKKRNLRPRKQRDGHSVGETESPAGRCHGPETGAFQTDGSNSHSGQKVNATEGRESTEVSSRTKDGSISRRGNSTAPSRTPRSQHTDRRNNVGTEKSRNTIVVVADVCVSSTGQSTHGPEQGDSVSGRSVTQRGSPAEPTDQGVCHISRLMKVLASELSDFVPPKDGSEVYHKSPLK